MRKAFSGALSDKGWPPSTPFSRDAYFIVRKPLIAGNQALTVPSQTWDPDAIVSRGGRHLFLVPWRGSPWSASGTKSIWAARRL